MEGTQEAVHSSPEDNTSTGKEIMMIGKNEASVNIITPSKDNTSTGKEIVMIGKNEASVNIITPSKDNTSTGKEIVMIGKNEASVNIITPSKANGNEIVMVDSQTSAMVSPTSYNGQEIVLIKQLDSLKYVPLLKLRVVRLWENPSNDNPNVTYSIDLILMDEEGQKIMARVWNQQVAKFKGLLKENQAYYIKSTVLDNQTTKFFCTDHPQKLRFTYRTVATICSDFAGSMFGFAFVEIETILSSKILENQAFDVIGEIIQFGTLIATNRDPSKHRFNICIRNLNGTQIDVTLWGKHAYAMDDLVKSRMENSRDIIVIQFGNKQFFKGVPYVQTYYQFSRVFLNSDIDEINHFRNSMVQQNTHQATSSSTSSRILNNTISEMDDFLKVDRFRKIREVLTVPEENTYILYGKIVGILMDDEWYYLACNGCLAKVSEILDIGQHFDRSKAMVYKGGYYECLNFNCTAPLKSVIPRYTIPIKVKDDSGMIDLTMFDSPAVQLLGHSVKTLIDRALKRGDGLDLFPDEMNTLRRKSMCFKIVVKRYNTTNNSTVYGITRVCEDQNIIGQLRHQGLITMSESTTFPIPISTSQETNSITAVSHTDDNLTPTTPQTSKRIEADVVDVDNPESFSASKKLCLSAEKEKDLKLLKPKLEK